MRATDTVASEWAEEHLDLPAYLDRVSLGRDAVASPDLPTLARLQRAHQRAIPFGNIDILLGRGIGLDMDVVQRKLVTGRREGYCHEHNLLFAAVLSRLGYRVTRLTGRVRAGRNATLRPRTHMMSLTALGGVDLLVDVGVGGHAPVEPIPMRDGAEARQDGWVYRLDQASPDGWVLRMAENGGWSDLYSFGPEPAHLVDYVVATHYTSTHPHSPFVRGLRMTLNVSGHRLLLQDRTLAELHPGETVSRGELDDHALASVVTDTFGVRLSDAELAELTRLTSPDRKESPHVD